MISLSPPRVEEACVGREEKKKKIGRVWPGSKSGGSNLDLRGLQVSYLVSGGLSLERSLQPRHNITRSTVHSKYLPVDTSLDITLFPL